MEEFIQRKPIPTREITEHQSRKTLEWLLGPPGLLKWTSTEWMAPGCRLNLVPTLHPLLSPLHFAASAELGKDNFNHFWALPWNRVQSRKKQVCRLIIPSPGKRQAF